MKTREGNEYAKICRYVFGKLSRQTDALYRIKYKRLGARIYYKSF